MNPDDDAVVQIIDQRMLPHEYRIHNLRSWQDGVVAISDMYVRGAPLIGATAAWSLYLAAIKAIDTESEVQAAAGALLESRPTAVNLRWAVERVMSRLKSATTADELRSLAKQEAENICDEDIEISRGIGSNGLQLIEEIARHGAG